MSIWDERKIDCHNHILDPDRIAYAADTRDRPSGQAIATADELFTAFDAYGVLHALIVGPNSGYGTDNACLLDAIRRGAAASRALRWSHPIWAPTRWPTSRPRASSVWPSTRRSGVCHIISKPRRCWAGRGHAGGGGAVLRDLR